MHCVDGIRRGADREVGPSAYLRPLARFGRGGNRPRGGSVGPVMRTLTPQVAVWAPCPRCHLKGPATYRRVGATTCGAQLPGETHEAVVDSWRARSDSGQRVCDGGHQRCRCLNCCCPHLCVRAPIALLRGVRVLQHKGARQAYRPTRPGLVVARRCYSEALKTSVPRGAHGVRVGDQLIETQVGDVDDLAEREASLAGGGVLDAAPARGQ